MKWLIGTWSFVVFAAVFLLMGCGLGANVSAVAGAPPRLKVATSSNANDLKAEPFAVHGRAKLTRLGSNRFSVTCDGIERCTAAQKGLNWCWAAASEALLRYDSVNDITQQKLADKYVLGKDMSVQPTVVMRALHPELDRQLDNVVFIKPNFAEDPGTADVPVVMEDSGDHSYLT